MTFLATIVASTFLVEVYSAGTMNVPNKSCHCRIRNALHINGLCLRKLPCKSSPLLPNVSDRKLGNKIVVYNRRVYRAYPAVARRSRRCPIANTLYNKKFGACIRLLKCFEKLLGVSNRAISRRYYVYSNKIYKSYPAYCQ